MSRIDPCLCRIPLVLFFRWVVGGVFIGSGLTKLVNPGQFAALVASYNIFPAAWIPAIAVLLPWLELVCGLSLLANRLSRGGALILAVLLGVFIGLHLVNLSRGIDVACGCFSLSPDARSEGWISILRNTLMLSMSVGVLLGKDSRQGAVP